MLNVYALDGCPHCRRTIAYLKENRIDFVYHDMEQQTESIEKKIIEVNGGEDWVVPTIEYRGIWRRGKEFDARELKKDLIDMGVFEESIK